MRMIAGAIVLLAASVLGVVAVQSKSVDAPAVLGGTAFLLGMFGFAVFISGLIDDFRKPKP